MRVRYQADTGSSHRSVISSLSSIKPGQLYSGLPFKLAFSSIFAYYLTMSGSNQGLGELKNLPLLALTYP